jgi:polyphosphate kinase 2
MTKITLTKNQREKANKRYAELLELRLFQEELIKFQQYIEKTGDKLVVVFEGRDAAGKGGTIRRILEDLNPKNSRAIALGRPSDREMKQDYFQRYTSYFPAEGEIVLFDRSWYNRTMVEPALCFCTKEEYEDYISRVSQFEKLYFNNNSEKKHKRKTILIKIYFSISKEEQDRRFSKRQTNARKKWKFSEADAQMQDKWDIFTDLKYKMLKKTNTSSNPWDIIKSDNKHLARITAMKLILRSLKYENKNPELELTLNKKVWVSGDCELAEMKADRSYN